MWNKMDWFCAENRDSLLTFPLFSCSLKSSSRETAVVQLPAASRPPPPRLGSPLTTLLVLEVSPGSAPSQLTPVSLPHSVAHFTLLGYAQLRWRQVSRDALFCHWTDGLGEGSSHPSRLLQLPWQNYRNASFPSQLSCLDNTLHANSMVTCILNI